MYCIAIRPCLVLAVTTTTIAAVDQAAMYSCIILPESSSSLLQFSLINLFSCFRSLSLHMHQSYLIPSFSTPYHFQYTLPACLAFNSTPSRLLLALLQLPPCTCAKLPHAPHTFAHQQFTSFSCLVARTRHNSGITPQHSHDASSMPQYQLFSFPSGLHTTYACACIFGTLCRLIVVFPLSYFWAITGSIDVQFVSPQSAPMIKVYHIFLVHLRPVSRLFPRT